MTPGRDVSPWIARFMPMIPPGGTVVDVAAGSGRHTRHLLANGYTVVAVDRDTSALADLGDHDDLEVVTADLEADGWPLADRRFDGVVVTDYLHRPLLPTLVAALAPGGVLLYETYAEGQQRHGRPRNPDFLLQPGELLRAVDGAQRVLAYEDVELPRPACVQRIAARRSGGRTAMTGGRPSTLRVP